MSTAAHPRGLLARARDVRRARAERGACACNARSAHVRDDRGSALIEFVGVSVILLLPLLYLLLTVFQLQRGSFAASEAAREAGRAFALAPSSEVGVQRAQEAADLAFGDQGIDSPPEVSFTAAGAGCGAAAEITPRLQPGATYTVCVRQDVTLPYADRGFFAHLVPARIHLLGTYSLAVDRYRAPA